MSGVAFFKPVLVMASLFVSLSVPGLVFADDYRWMLSVLNANRIDGQVGSGASGNMSFNSASGTGNLQANQRVLQQSASALAVVSPAGAVGGALGRNVRDHSGQVAQTEIGGQAFSHGSGFLGINQVSGMGNAQLNTIVVGGVSQSLGQIRATGGDSTSSQLPNPADRHANQSAAKDASDRYSAIIGDGALSGFGGVLQINQVSGIGNVTANHFSVSMP